MYTLVFLGIIGNILSIIFFLSPILIMVNLIKTGETKTVPSLLFMFTLLNCELWFIYGVQEDSWEIYICNFLGLLLNTIYLNLFCVYLKNMKTKILYIVLEYTIITVILFYFMYIVKSKSVTGLLAMIFNIFMYLSPMQKTYEVFKFKTNIYIPLSTILSLIACSALWMTVGILMNNINIIIPNVIGQVIGLFQMILYFYFRDKTTEDNYNTKIDKTYKENDSIPKIINQN